jgi:gliding-associated putative ABC transporter substrate-binding component GldG
MGKNVLTKLFPGILLLVIVNLVSAWLYHRFDLTEDRRFTLSAQAAKTVEGFETPVVVDVLLDGEMPAEFSRLRTETKLLLEAFRSKNQQIRVNFIDPMQGADDPETVMANLRGLGLTPVNVTVGGKATTSQALLFPWALVNNNNKTVKVSLLKNQLGSDTEQRINNSVQNLEYAFADGFTKLGITEKKKVAVIKGNGELDDIEIADFLSTLREYYNIGAITLDSVGTNPQKVLRQLEGFDLALIAKPTEPFTDPEKYVLDQYIVHGGKSIWLIDRVAMELDSLFNDTGSAYALPRDLQLQDFLFRYGVRMNPVLVNDLYFTQIVLAQGEGNTSQYNPVPWYYHPMVFSENNHPINTNLEAIRFQFAGTIDTLPNAYKKTILYSSSPLSKTEAAPREIRLDVIQSPPDKTTYTNGNQPLAVLVEGDFVSAYSNRVKPVALDDNMDKGPSNKMIVIADGDVVRNQLKNGRPLELGYDKWTNNFYGNKEFLLNCVNYMLDDEGLINIRSKRITIPVLDREKIGEGMLRWQLFNIVLPIGAVLLFGFLFNILRKRKYGR